MLIQGNDSQPIVEERLAKNFEAFFKGEGGGLAYRKAVRRCARLQRQTETCRQ
jgi:hypothetical protein